jgi:high-affinity iron transporter
VSLLLYRGLLAIPLHRLFTVTNVLVALLAAGMAGQAASILAGADLIPAWGYQIWDTSWLLSDGGLLGRTLKAMFGYSDRPMGVQLAAYVTTLLVLVLANRIIHDLPSRPAVDRQNSQFTNPEGGL